ncbi:unnamed protein product [Mycena citricolor]|uniref:BZIP domain-containing protein n=1 Tax=Mycena citricolor TaxID=2018698 RepID=A0AAD2GTQ0_9AGAR|nr:unnamed protein product [Mycena citricolor]
MSSLTGSAERPERSRNAKAQARHRAKRKAYIEQLEQTVTKLQTALGASGDQLTAIPPPLARIRDLEQENDRLLKENEALHRMLQEANGGRPISMELGARRASPLGSFNDSRNACDRDYKRRKMETSNVDDYILNSYGTHSRAHSHSPPSIGLSRHSPSSSSHTPDPHSRPPPLSIPHHFHHGPTNHGPASAPPPLYGLGGPPPAFQMPHTPSGSSSTSSPPFSASIFP